MAGCLFLPFAELSANRIASGVGLSPFASAGMAWGVVFVGTLVLMLAAAFMPQRWRGLAVLVTAIAAFGALLFATGAASAHLSPQDGSPTRVSVGAGAWIVLAGVGIAWFQGARTTRSRRTKAAAAAAALALLVGAGLFGGLGTQSLAIEYQNQSDSFWLLVGRHVMLSVGGVALGALVGVPLGIVSARFKPVRSIAMPIVSVIQTVPSLALFGLLMTGLTALALPSIGTVPTLVALTLYSLLPIVRNTFMGIDGVDPAIVSAGLGMGMGRAQLLWRVELPLALPLVLEGLRSALVLTIGIAAVMAIGGANDLGTLIFLGIGSEAMDLVLLGALPMVLLAIVADQIMRALQAAIVSPGLKEVVA